MTAIVHRVAQRWVLQAKCRLVGPLAIGGAEGLGLTDQLATRDGLGRLVIPGTSLAGVLRARCADLDGVDSTQVSTWFGDLDDEFGASRIVVDDAVIKDGVVEIRDGIGIDRRTGTVAEHLKFTREIVGAGATTNIVITVDVPRDGVVADTVDGQRDGSEHRRPSPGVPDIICGLVTLLEDGITLGSGIGKGFGAICLADDASIEVTVQDFRTRVSTIEALRGGWHVKPADIKRLESGRPVAVFTLPWEPTGSILVRAGRDGNIVDDLPLVTTDEMATDKVRFVLPGSSIKGALRTRAEWIVRTVLDLDTSENFTDQLAVPLVDVLFGAAPRPAPPDTDGHLRSTAGAKAALTVAESRTTAAIDRKVWEKIAVMSRPEDTVKGRYFNDFFDILDALDKADTDKPDFSGRLEPAAHVAIDRWTSAPVHGALFSTLELWANAWEPITLTVDIAILEQRLDSHQMERDRNAAMFLLLLTLRDLADGWVPLGFATNRGSGSVRMTDPGMGITTHGTWGERSPLPDLIPLSWDVEVDTLAAAWGDWVAANRRKGEVA